MMTLIEDKLKKQENTSVTENGARGYKTSESALVDINYQVSSLRSSDEDEIIKLFDEAFYENKEYALKWLFFARDVREGLGERRLFRICYKRLATLNNDLFIKNLHNIAEYGRWDDMISLLGISKSEDDHIMAIITLQLKHDLKNFNENKPISLLAKWLPSENASSMDTKILAKKIRKNLGLSPREYRIMLSKLRAYTDVVEVKMCDNRWSDIDYEKVPSLANLRYKKAFYKHDEERRIEYLNSVNEGKKKMNMQVATPVDIVSRYGSRIINEFDPTLELAWKNLKNIAIKDTLVVADGSGSMTMTIGNGKTTALDVANALAIYTSEHNHGVYKNKYITFSNKPQFVKFKESSSLREKLQEAHSHKEVSNTNIEAVFDLILNIAKEYEIPSNKMIKNILIISDMEFDSAQRAWYRDTTPLNQPLFESIKQRYNEAGYSLPKLIFWNVNSRTKTIPLIENDLGVTLVSGFSQNVLKMVMSNKYNPYDVLIETITNERYDAIICE